MSKSGKPGVFITFEGGEGAGKTTQINKLSKYLSGQGYKVVTTREPGGTPEAEKIRSLLVQRDGGNWNAMAETLLLFAARVMHVENIIKPAIKDGSVVVCDRFTDSTLAYQGYGHGLDISSIQDIQKTTLSGFAPDITLILDIDVEEGLGRSHKRLSAEKGYDKTEDRFERLDSSFHEKLRQGFLDIAKNDPKRCHVVNAAQDADSVFENIKTIVQKKMH